MKRVAEAAGVRKFLAPYLVVEDCARIKAGQHG